MGAKKHEFRVQHCELISDVFGSTGFALTQFPINPGISSSFPWLSQLADMFEEWKPNAITFCYRPMSGSAVNSASAALGSIIMATDYNALNQPFVNKQAMESYEGAQSVVPFNPVCHTVECNKSLNPMGIFYTRSGGAPTGSDLRLYDLGNFYVATQGFQTAYDAGELWISYDITFFKPRLIPQEDNADGNTTDHFTTYPYNTGTGNQPGGTTTPPNATWHNVSPSPTGNTVSCNGVGNMQVSCLAGSHWLVSITGVSGANATTAMTPPSYNNGAVAANIWDNNTGYFIYSAVGQTVSTLSFVMDTTAVTPGRFGLAQIGITRSTGSTTDQFDVLITPYYGLPQVNA
jgi:hypothetical protein